MDWQGELEQYLYANTVPPPPPGGLHVFISNAFEEGGGDFREGGLFNLAKTMVSVLRKQLQ